MALQLLPRNSPPGSLVSLLFTTRSISVSGLRFTRASCARQPYLTLVPGDNAFHASGLDDVFALVGKVPMVVTYRANPRAARRCGGSCPAVARRECGVVTGKPIRDAHSLYVFPVAQARQVRRNTGYGYHIETLSTLLRGGVPYAEVPVVLNPRPDSSSKVMRLSVLARLIATLGRQFIRFVVLRRKVRFAAVPRAAVQSRPEPESVAA